MNPVLVAAAKFELDPLVNALQERGHTPEARLTGIGALNAAKKALRLADACRGRDVIFVGTCGSFTPFTKVYLVRATGVHWSPTCERMGLSYTVKDSAPEIALPEPPTFCRSLPPRRVVCSPGISLVGKPPEGIAADTVVENLELYACVGEILAAAASLAVILAVTNAVGPDSHAQWRQNYAGAAGLTAEFIGARLGKGAG
jgi:hypothetical protein